MSAIQNYNDVGFEHYHDNYIPDALELVLQAYGGDSLSWNELRVYHNRLTGEMAYGRASGCSCDNWETRFHSFSNLTKFDWNTFMVQLREVTGLDAADRVEHVATVAKFMENR